MALKIEGKLYALALTSAAYCAAIPFLTDHPALLCLTGALIVANFALSMWHLIRRGQLSLEVILLNLVQLALFGCLHVQIYTILGAHHYACAAAPRWYHWVQLIVVHVLRAIDILDGIEAYGLSLQNVKNASVLSGTVLVCMHIMVDTLLLSAVVQFVRRRIVSAQGQASGGFPLGKLAEYADEFRWTALISVFCLTAIVASIGRWNVVTWLLWPLDNVLRTVDVGDAFQVYGWRLHGLEMSLGLATLAVIVRLGAAWSLAPLVARVLLRTTGGRAKTVHELARIVRSYACSWDEAGVIAIQALGAKGSNAAAAIPDLVRALADSFGNASSAAAEALEKIDPGWRDSEGAKGVIPDLVKALANEEKSLREAAARALCMVDPDWGSSEGARQAILGLLKALASKKYGVHEAAAEALCNIDPGWQNSEAARQAVPGLVRALADSFGCGEKCAVIKALEAIDPGWRDSEGARDAFPDLVKGLADVSEFVREAAAGGLGEMGPVAASAVPDLANVLADEKWAVRKAAAEALGNMGSVATSAVPGLVKTLADEEVIFVPEAAARALGKIGPAAASAVPDLAKALAEPKSVSGAAAEALGNIGPAAVSAVADLVRALTRTEHEVYKVAAEALEKIDPHWRYLRATKQILPELIKKGAEAMADGYTWEPTVYGRVLERLDPDWRNSEGARLAIPALVRKAQASPSQSVRTAAASALNKISPKHRLYRR